MKPKVNTNTHNNPPNPVPYVPDGPDSDPSLSDSSSSESSDSSDNKYYKLIQRSKTYKKKFRIKPVSMNQSKTAQSLQASYLQLRKIEVCKVKIGQGSTTVSGLFTLLHQFTSNFIITIFRNIHVTYGLSIHNRGIITILC